MKSKIAAIEHRDNKIYIRIKQDSSSQKNYNRFRQDVIDQFKVIIKDHKGFTEFIGKKIDINVFKDSNYIHLVLYLKPKFEKQILNILMKYFEFMKPI